MQDTQNLRLLFIVFSKQNLENHEESSNNNRIMLSNVILGNIPGFALMIFLYFNVQIIKSKTKFKKRHQINIVSFNHNFFFYIIFVIAHVILTLIRINVLKIARSEEVETILICSYIVNIFISWFIRPVMIISILKKNIPDFFDDFEIPIREKGFTIRVENIHPRQQKFLSYKPFCQDARWGSESKFQIDQAFDVNQEKRSYRDGKSNVVPDVYF